MGKVNPKDLVLAVQSPKEAVYGLFLGEKANATFDPEKLTIVARSCGSNGMLGMFLDVAIIGESHFVRLIRVEDNKTLFTELLACIDPSRFGFEPTANNCFSQFNQFSFLHYNAETGLLVDTRSSIRPKTRDRRSFVPHLPFEDQRRNLCVRLKKPFPGPLNPRTIVSVVLNNNYLDILTVHEYVTPDNHIEPLTSQTRVTLRP